MDQIKECKCHLCRRDKEFYKHIENVTNDESKKWFEDLYNILFDTEEILNCHKIYSNNLETLYPKIWKETHTLSKLSKDNAQFPEKQI